MMNKERTRFYASAEDFKKIPGAPVAYWVSEAIVKCFQSFKTLETFVDSSVGLQTGDNNKFIRSWWEVEFGSIKFDARCKQDTFQERRYFPYNKGGEYRKWHGNNECVVVWQNDGQAIIKNAELTGHHWQQYDDKLKFKPMITWSRIACNNSAFRYKPYGYMSDMAGFSLYPHDAGDMSLILGFTNSKPCVEFLKFLSPTLNIMLGQVLGLPLCHTADVKNRIAGVVNKILSLANADYSTYETSWDFIANPMVAEIGHAGRVTLPELYAAVREKWAKDCEEMRRLETENNRIFIEAYGLQEELTPEVPWNEITLTCNPWYRYGVKVEEKLQTEATGTSLPHCPELEARLRTDTVKELISYAIGCLMGRYSLEKEGLIIASQGETSEDYWKKVGGKNANTKLEPDDDGIIPLIAGANAFTDNGPKRVVDFLRAAFGVDHLNANLNFVEECLGETLEQYLVKDFWKDHKKTYQNRPIYWLFASKKGAFQALVYMHRMDAYTVSKIRSSYLLPHIEFLRGRIAADAARGAELTAKERTALKKMQQAVTECLEYDERLHVVADRMQAIDLDDGVVVNYAKFGDVVAKIK